MFMNGASTSTVAIRPTGSSEVVVGAAVRGVVRSLTVAGANPPGVSMTVAFVFLDLFSSEPLFHLYKRSSQTIMDSPKRCMSKGESMRGKDRSDNGKSLGLNDKRKKSQRKSPIEKSMRRHQSNKVIQSFPFRGTKTIVFGTQTLRARSK